MVKEHTFATLGRTEQKKGNAPEIGIGVMGFGFMGKAHLNAYKEISPYGATFEDGYRCAVICNAILESSRTGQRIKIKY